MRLKQTIYGLIGWLTTSLCPCEITEGKSCKKNITNNIHCIYVVVLAFMGMGMGMGISYTLIKFI